jgi:hypothetical protein
MAVKTFQVKGTSFYEADAEVSAKRARKDSVVILRRDPTNPYDSDAVRVLLAQNEAFLGHVPRKMSAQVSERILLGFVKKAFIRSVEREVGYLKIKVTYEFHLPPKLDLASGGAQDRLTQTMHPVPPPSVSQMPATGISREAQFVGRVSPANGESDSGIGNWFVIMLVIAGIVLFLINI